MPTRYFTIATSPPTEAKLKAGAEAQFVFTVTSLAAPDETDDVIVRATVGDDRSEAPWISIEPGGELRVAGGQTQSISVRVKAPSAVTPGKQRLQLVVARARESSEAYDESPPIEIEFVETGAAKAPRKFPWWIVAVGAALVLAGVGLGLWKMFQPKPLELLAACDPNASACPPELVCGKERRQCVLTGGSTCRRSEECESGVCGQTDGLCALEVLAPCEPGRAGVSCVPNASCDEKRKQCLIHAGSACQGAEQCATGQCEAGVCTTAAPPLSVGDPCTDACPRPLFCEPGSKRCLGRQGFEGCRKHADCLTRFCDHGICSVLERFRDCKADGLCAPEQRCMDFGAGKGCFNEPGRACTGNGQCTSGFCAGQVCSPDNGVCTRPSDCPPQYTCSLADKRCLLANGRTCTEPSECISRFCSPVNNSCQASPCGVCNALTYCDIKTGTCKRRDVIKPPLKVLDRMYFIEQAVPEIQRLRIAK